MTGIPRNTVEAKVQQAILKGDIAELRLALGEASGQLTASDLAIAQRALTTMESLGAENASLLASRYGVDFANTVNHAFANAARHKLGPLLQSYGSPAQAFVEVQKVVDAAFAASGTIPRAVQVGAFNVEVRGAIVDGAVRIRTFFIP